MLDSPAQNVGAKRKRLCAALLVLAGAVIFGVLVGVALVILHIRDGLINEQNYRGACATSIAFERALFDDRIADAYSLTTRQFQQQQSLEAFKGLVGRYPAVKGPYGKEYVNDGNVDHPFGSEIMTFDTRISNNGFFASFTYVIVREDGQWKVDSLTFK